MAAPQPRRLLFPTPFRPLSLVPIPEYDHPLVGDFSASGRFATSQRQLQVGVGRLQPLLGTAHRGTHTGRWGWMGRDGYRGSLRFPSGGVLSRRRPHPHFFLIHPPTHRIARDHHPRRAWPSRIGSWRMCTTTSPSRGFITRTDTPRSHKPLSPPLPHGLTLRAPFLPPFPAPRRSTFSASRSQSADSDEELWAAKRHALEHYERARDTYTARLAAKAAGRLDVLSTLHPTSLTQGKAVCPVPYFSLLPHPHSLPLVVSPGCRVRARLWRRQQ